MHPNHQIAVNWFKAFNEHQLENLLSLYHDDAEHYSPKLKLRMPETNGLIKGKKALDFWWADAFERLPQLHYKILNIIANDEFVFMEYIRTTPNEPDLQVGEVLVIKDGKIVASRVYHS
jgi:predicted SnoaL-like aldol condensation-catalyzing enzyme